MIDITPILTSALQLVAAIFIIMGTFVIKVYLIPWLKSKLTQEQQDRVKEYIKAAMEAAEQLQQNGYFDGIEEQGKAKKDYVIKQVKAYCEKYGFTFDETTVDTLIESLVIDIS